MNLEPSHQPPVSVFIVDDEEDLRLLLRQWLASSERFHLVGESDNGSHAIEMARRLEPDIIVMDVGIPRGGGEEATRIIGSLCPASRVLAHTASSDREHVLDMIGAGVRGYLVKSGSFEEFLGALDAIADGGTYLSPRIGIDLFEHIRAAQTRQRALDHRDPGEPSIALQPIVHIASGVVVGYEALARFAHGDPGPIFKAASRAGRGLELELTAARAAVRATRHLGDVVDFICINVSPETVLTTDFRQLVSETNPLRTVIELTENAEVSDYPKLRAVLGPLRDQGFRLAVDDVGGGFSSLSHVHQLAPDLIKIDRYLVEDIDRDPIRQTMVSALAAIAERSEARIVAEGVERPGQLRILSELGIELAQGFLLGVPERVGADVSDHSMS